MKPARHLMMKIGLGAVALAALGFGAHALTTTPEGPQVATAIASMGNVENAVLASGSLHPSNVLPVGSEVAGRIISLKVKLGDLVKQGDLIAMIDPERLNSLVQQQQNTIIQAQNTLRDRQAQAEQARGEADRQKSLFDQGVASRVTYDTAVASQRSAESQVENQRQQLANAQLVLEQRKADLDKTNIRAPIDGVVAEIVAKQGDTLSIIGGAPTVVKLAQTDRMTVRTEVSEADINKVRPGQQVYFTILGDPETRRYATVASREISPVGVSLDPENTTANPNAIYYNVTFETPNPDDVLLPSMTAEVHVVLNHAVNVLTVPVASITDGASGKRTVEIVDARGEISTREVTVGVENSFTAEIRSGLKVGDRVVV